jgi:hypothetical protein
MTAGGSEERGDDRESTIRTAELVGPPGDDPESTIRTAELVGPPGDDPESTIRPNPLRRLGRSVFSLAASQRNARRRPSRTRFTRSTLGSSTVSQRPQQSGGHCDSAMLQVHCLERDWSGRWPIRARAAGLDERPPSIRPEPVPTAPFASNTMLSTQRRAVTGLAAVAGNAAVAGRAAIAGRASVVGP